MQEFIDASPRQTKVYIGGEKKEKEVSEISIKRLLSNLRDP